MGTDVYSGLQGNGKACGRIYNYSNGIINLLSEDDSIIVQKVVGRSQARFYDVFLARGGFRRFYSKWRFMDEVNEFMDFFDLKLKDTVIDIGCGTGNYTIELAKRASQSIVIGIDFSLAMLELCKKNIEKQGLKNILLFQANAENLPFKESSLTNICQGCLHLLDDIIPSLRNVYRCLTPGGILFGMSLGQSEKVKSKIIQNIFARISHSNLVNQTVIELCLRNVGFINYKYMITGFVNAFRAERD